MPPKITLDSESGVYTVKQGREIVIAPNYESADEATYKWTMDGRLLGNEPSPSLLIADKTISELLFAVIFIYSPK